MIRERSRAGRAAAACLVLAACAGGRAPSRPVAHVPVAKGALSLEAANARWRGARCELVSPLEVRKGPDDRGWHSSGRILIDQPGSRRFYLHVLVSGPEALGPFYVQRSVQPGARLVSTGWTLAKPAEGKGPYLELQFDRSAARARFEFQETSSFSSANFPLERLGEVEQYLRLNILKVALASDELQDVPAY